MTYIFDFDGVLANTLEPYVEFVSKHFFLSPQKSRELILSHTLKNDRPKLYEKMLEMFNIRKLEVFLKTKPNILFQDRLNEILLLDGKKCILTRNYTQFVKDILGDYLVYFDPIVGFDEATNKTIGFTLLRDLHNIDLSQALFITDTVGDILEAQHFMPNTHIFAANWGYNTIEELGQVIEKTQIISDLKETTLRVGG